MSKFTRFVGAAGVATLVAISGTAFTNSNTFEGADNAGSGSKAITGYTVSAVEYVPNSADPQKLDAVKFTLSGAATYVAIRTNDATTAVWFKSDDNRVDSTTDSCTAIGNAWTCNTTGTDPAETVAGATNLTVVATN